MKQFIFKALTFAVGMKAIAQLYKKFASFFL